MPSEEQLTSYTTQKKVYTEMIASRPDWELAGIYADEGISGTRADKRPQFQKMIKDCYAGKIDYIVTKSVSRFARNTVDCLEHVRIEKHIKMSTMTASFVKWSSASKCSLMDASKFTSAAGTVWKKGFKKERRLRKIEAAVFNTIITLAYM